MLRAIWKRCWIIFPSRTPRQPSNVAMLMYGVGVNINPFFGVFYSRLGEVASRSMFDKLNERNDPRIRRCYVEANSQTMIASKDESIIESCS